MKHSQEESHNGHPAMLFVLDELDPTVDNGLPPPEEFEEDMANDQKLNELTQKVDRLKSDVAAAKTQIDGMTTSLGAINTTLARIEERGNHHSALLRYAAIIAVAWMGYLTYSLDDAKKQLSTTGRTVSTLVTASNVLEATNLPVTADSSKRVAEVVSQAQNDGTKISPVLVDFAGKKFADASLTQPDAWFATSVILNYKTSLNSEPINAVQISQPFKNVHWNLGYPGSPDWEGQMSFGGSATGDNRAEIHLIDRPSTLNPSVPFAHYVVIKGGRFDIDGMFLKGVVFIDSQIAYRGDPVKMEHVYFINCTFQMPPSKNTLLLADSILSPNSAIDFSVD